MLNSAQKSFIKGLEKAPKVAKKDIHLWTDHLELLCLVSVDGILSLNDYVDRIKNRQTDLGETDLEEDEIAQPKPEADDKRELEAQDAFRLAEYRQGALRDSYPFLISPDCKEISLLEALDENQKFYIFLLLCSSLRVCAEYQSVLTSCFEIASWFSMQKCLPDYAESYLFGASNAEPLFPKHHTGDFETKVGQLAQRLGEQVRPAKKTAGDGGLDVYGYIPLGDTQRHFPVFFGQAGCTLKWVEKQNSSKYDRWQSFISLSIYPINFIFIPFSFRDSNGDWHEEYLIEMSVLMDRHRIIHLVRDKIGEFTYFQSSRVVEEILQCKEPIV